MKLVLIAGKARSGKTETAKLLKEKLQAKNQKVAITEFSKYIKMFAKEFTNWDGVSEPKPRRFLQDFGSYIRHQSNNPNYFVQRMQEDILIYQELLDVLIISDVRLKAEIENFLNLQPITIHVSNDKNIYDLSEEEKQHETEHDLDFYESWNYNFENREIQEIDLLLDKVVQECLKI